MLRWVDVNLNRGRATVIASRPGVGKTCLALRLTRSVLERTAAGVAYFSLEMPRRQLATGLACARSGVPIREAVHGRPSRAESRSLHVVDTMGVTMEQVLDRFQMLHAENGVKVAFIDYVPLVHRVSEDLAQEARALRSALGKLPVDVFVLCQVRPCRGGRPGPLDVPFRDDDPHHLPTWRTVVLHRDRDESGGLAPELHVDLYERGETEPSYSESGQLDRQSGRICLGSLLS